MGKPEYLAALSEAAGRLRAAAPERVTVVHHNDADGVASSAVLSASLARAGFRVTRIPLERVHRPINERLHDTLQGQPVIYVDLGARAAPMIAEVNAGRSLTLIVDHHMAEPVDDATVMNLSTEIYGLSGEQDVSAATAAWMFALALDEANEDLAYLGVIGAIGDSHERGGHLVGENRQALNAALRRGHVSIDEKEGRESYVLRKFGPAQPLKPLAKSLTTLGAAGYAMQGPELAVACCLDGPSPEQGEKLHELESVKEERFRAVTARLERDGLTHSRHVQWFSVGEGFAPMGVKIVGEYCMELRDSAFVASAKYIAGFQDMPAEVPGLGRFDWDLVKMSMRVPSPLEERIVNGEMPGLSWLLPEAAKRVDGSIDACHDYAAAALVERGKEEAIIQALDELVAASADSGGRS